MNGVLLNYISLYFPGKLACIIFFLCKKKYTLPRIKRKKNRPEINQLIKFGRFKKLKFLLPTFDVQDQQNVYGIAYMYGRINLIRYFHEKTNLINGKFLEGFYFSRIKGIECLQFCFWNNLNISQSGLPRYFIKTNQLDCFQLLMNERPNIDKQYILDFAFAYNKRNFVEYFQKLNYPVSYTSIDYILKYNYIDFIYPALDNYAEMIQKTKIPDRISMDIETAFVEYNYLPGFVYYHDVLKFRSNYPSVIYTAIEKYKRFDFFLYFTKKYKTTRKEIEAMVLLGFHVFMKTQSAQEIGYYLNLLIELDYSPEICKKICSFLTS